MTDATILIPTFRHAALVPYSLRSALTQEGAVVEVFVVGDGVEEDTRVALAPSRREGRASGTQTDSDGARASGEGTGARTRSGMFELEVTREEKNFISEGS